MRKQRAFARGNPEIGCSAASDFHSSDKNQPPATIFLLQTPEVQVTVSLSPVNEFLTFEPAPVLFFLGLLAFLSLFPFWDQITIRNLSTTISFRILLNPQFWKPNL